MSLLVVGLNHKTAPISLLERLAISDEELVKALAQLNNYEHILEGAILSTCNRVEIYATASRFHGGVQDLRNFLSEFRHVPPEDFTDHLYTYHDETALAHLFRVAAGVDSLIIGESEILGQVRRAHQVALSESSIQRVLGRAFAQAMRVGKRARTETAIGRNPVSISSAAVELARRALPGDSLQGRSVTLVGAGKMGGLAARALANAGVERVMVVNRTESRAEELAATFGARSLPWDRLEDALAEADIAICSTTAPGHVVDAATVERVLRKRADGSPLFIVDIAVPRDVAPEVARIPGVVLKDIEDLSGVVESSIGSRLGEVAAVEDIVAEELQRFLAWEDAGELVPAITKLLERAEAIRTAESQRVQARLVDLSEQQKDAVEQMTKRIVAKLLHDPLERAKQLGSSKRGHAHLDALRELFELDDDPAD